MFLGRNGRVSVFGSERSLARYLADEHDHDLSDLATYEDIKTAATDGSLHVDVTDDNVYVTSGLADDIAEGRTPSTATSWSSPSSCCRDVGDYAEDDIVDETLDADMPLGRLVAHVLDPDTVRKPSAPYAEAVEQWESLETFLESQAAPGVAPTLARKAQSLPTRSTRHALMCLLGKHAQFLHVWHLGLIRGTPFFLPVALTGNEYLATRVECGVLPHGGGRPQGTGMVTMTAEQQQALDSFYALDNVITVKITMPQAEWDAVRNEEPEGGRCNFEWTGGSQVHLAQGRPRSRYPEQSSPRRPRSPTWASRRNHSAAPSTATSRACMSTSASSATPTSPRSKP